MNKRYPAIRNRLTRRDRSQMSIWQHPHRQKLKYYQYRVGLNRKPTQTETIWLNKHTKGCYSVDNTIAPYNISFVEKRDAIYFKLVWFGDLACDIH